MCGLVGIFDSRGQRPVDTELLSRMNETQHHRGPDEGGLHHEPGVGLGHRRLSIIDLASGQQPLFNEDHSVVVVYNGEIYNFASLAKELQRLGHEFRTHSDTEVIVHAWEQWGEACLERFRGMFAFALWDRNQQTLFLARDRMGIKPLYYALLPDGQLIFGSELKSLLVHPGLGREFDAQAVEDYCALGYAPEPKTILKGVRKMPPGYCLSVRRGDSPGEPRQYWDIPFVPLPDAPEAEWASSLVEKLKEAVDIRLVSEVPLGAFLSGGVDSSAIVALMAKLMDEPVNTCSISFGDPKFNEADFAAQVAERYQTRHFVDQVEADDFALLDNLASLYDEPFADSSAIPTYRVCELAKKHVTVALSGDGGDENLAGYRRYRWHMNEEQLRGRLPQWLRGPLFGFLGQVYPKIDWAPKMFRAKTTFQALARDSMAAYLHSVGVISESHRRELFTPNLKKELQGYTAFEVFRYHAERAPTDHPLSLIQYLDMKTYLPGDILTKVDRASMAHSLEVRVPILDHKFVEWVSGLPPQVKLNGGEGKYLFKKALEPVLPNDILYRPKMGFGVPISAWFRGPLRERVRSQLVEGSLAQSGLFEPAVVRRLVDEHQSGRREHSATLWSLLMFESSLRQLMGEGSGA
ncbi:MAG TPA: amidotransferase 1, exosortase A system-associated [Gammaproteobacteria bacterium]|nr:amidotransferase 1, exosortase A system-associated [Gammaproteobacteria bacterium]